MKILSCLTLCLLALSLPARAKTLVYVSEGGEKRIAIYSCNEDTGDLDHLGTLSLPGSPGCLALSRDGRRIYASVRSTSELATLEINPGNGLLTVLATTSAGGNAGYLYSDKTERWLLASYYGDGKVSATRIVEGIVQGPPVHMVETGKKAHCIQTDPSNRFALVPHTGELNKVQQLTFDAETGRLAFNDPEQLDGAEGAGPRHLQFHPNGKWVYLVNEQSKSVTHCSFDPASGTLSRHETRSTHPEDWDPASGSCADIEISADGKHLYASNRGHDSLAVFRINASTGTLTPMGQVPTSQTPRSFNLLPGGSWLVAAGQKGNELVVYQRDPESGKLTERKRYPCGRGPAWVLGVQVN